MRSFTFIFLLHFSLLVHGQYPTFQWVNSVGSPSIELGLDVATDANGNSYFIGSFSGTVDLDPGAGTFTLAPTTGTDIYIVKYDANGNFIWAKSFGGGQFTIGYSADVDQNGDVIAVGTYSGTVDFDPGPSVTNITSKGMLDIFILKISSSGNLIWARSVGGKSVDGEPSVDVDPSGNIYLGGTFADTADVDPGAPTYNLIGKYDEAFVLKLNSSGAFIWAKKVGGKLFDYAVSIATDNSSNAYITGFFRDTVDFDPGVGTYTLAAKGNDDAFILKLNSSGNFAWARAIGSTDFDQGYSIAVDKNTNDVFLTGFITGTVDLDPGPGTYPLSTLGGGTGFLAKYNSGGTLAWAFILSDTYDVNMWSVAVDAASYVYISGAFSDYIDFDPSTGTYGYNGGGAADGYIAKYDPSGNFVWLHAFGSTSAPCISYNVVVDQSFNVYCTGQFNSLTDFDPPTQTYTLVQNGNADAFHVKLTQPGAWIKDQTKDLQCQVFPNPFHDQLSITNNTPEKLHLKLFDLFGRVMCEFEVIEGKQNFKPQLSISQIYYYTLQGTEFFQSGKLIKE